MTGRVDGQLRALLPLPLAASRDGPRQDVEAWVDAAFNGGLALPRPVVAGLGLLQEASTDAVLVDGRTVTVEMFGCYLDWFGGTYQTQAVGGDATHPLLGTQLLAGRRLVIDYAAGTVELT